MTDAEKIYRHMASHGDVGDRSWSRIGTLLQAEEYERDRIQSKTYGLLHLNLFEHRIFPRETVFAAMELQEKNNNKGGQSHEQQNKN